MTEKELQTAAQKLDANVEQIYQLIEESKKLANEHGLVFELILANGELGGQFHNRSWDVYWQPSNQDC